MQEIYLVVKRTEGTAISTTIASFLKEEDAYKTTEYLNKRAEEKAEEERDECLALKLEELKNSCVGVYDDPDDLQDYLNSMYEFWKDDHEWKNISNYCVVKTGLYYSPEDYLKTQKEI